MKRRKYKPKPVRRPLPDYRNTEAGIRRLAEMIQESERRDDKRGGKA
jgi:hypothetical protein